MTRKDEKVVVSQSTVDLAVEELGERESVGRGVRFQVRHRRRGGEDGGGRGGVEEGRHDKIGWDGGRDGFSGE